MAMRSGEGFTKSQPGYRSGSKYGVALSQGKAYRSCRAIHSAVGVAVTAKWTPAYVQDAALALALVPEVALLLVLLAQPARPAPAASAVIAATAATVICRIRLAPQSKEFLFRTGRRACPCSASSHIIVDHIPADGGADGADVPQR